MDIIVPQPPDTHQLPSQDLTPEEQPWQLILLNGSELQRLRGNYIRDTVFSGVRIDAERQTYQLILERDFIWRFPLELVIMILSLLHPIDLYHAISAPSRLRDLLMDKDSTNIWKESYLNHPAMPFYPEDVSAPRWTSWLFDPATCEYCGKGNALFDFTFRRRRCNDCMDNRYAAEWPLRLEISRILKGFHEAQHAIWKLVPRAWRYTSFSYEPSGTDEDAEFSYGGVIRRALQMCELLLNIQNGVSGAQVKYDAFIKEKEAATNQRMEHAQRCNEFARGIYLHCKEVFAASVTDVARQAKWILIQRRYEEADIYSGLLKFIQCMTPEDDFVWSNTTEPALDNSKLGEYTRQIESMVQLAQTDRLQRELNETIEARKRVVVSLYHEFIGNICDPGCVPFMPRADHIFHLPAPKAYIHRPLGATCSWNPGPFKKQILDFIITYLSRYRMLLRQSLLRHGIQPFVSLRLATSIFHCCGEALIGWDQVGIHRCRNGPVYKVSYAGQKAVQQLAHLLDLDLCSLFISRLDSLNPRFICTHCRLVSRAMMLGCFSMTWRECVQHAVDVRPRPGQPPVVFTLLSEETTASLLRIEQPFPPPTSPEWFCKHCPWHKAQFLKMPQVVDHIKAVHLSVHQPTIDVDFAYRWTSKGPVREKVFVGLDTTSNHHHDPESRRGRSIRPFASTS